MIQKTAGTLAAVSDKTTDITLAHKLTCEPHTKTFTVFYGYDEFGRVASVSSAVPVLAFGFSYLPGTVVVSGMTGTAGLGRSVTFEPSQKLITGVSNVWVESPVAVFAYGNDVLGRRVARNAETFVYNGLSEVIGATIGTNGYGYAYDGIGNRIWSAENALTNIYTINCLNQYAGLSYDADGNLLSDGEHTFSWDAENRNTTVLSNGVPLVANSYDPQHQRVIKATPVSAHTFLYDGWLPVLEKITYSDGTAEASEHVWGKDLSGTGTRGGAGGVGGLLATRIGDAWFFPLYDNNGNITDYVNESGATVAHREYGPYGNTVAASGPMADTFNFWFSTKHLNHVTGWYYYGERLYSPELRRWLNCDPIGEKGGKNRYGFVGNDPVNGWDRLGRVAVSHNGMKAAAVTPVMMPDDYFTGLNMGNKDGSRPQPGEIYGVTRYSGAVVECACKKIPGDKKSGVPACYEMTCKVSWTATVYLNVAIKNEKKKLMGAYGHEQRHVKAVWDNVGSKIINPLKNKEGLFKKQEECSKASKKYKEQFLKMLIELTSNTTERHGIDGHPNERELYDPLPGSVWKGPLW